ncbi:hypothetical protein ACFYUM_12295 [Streptomyces fimicarius]|uniref:hypothetical protein n=1 Tax=Streptomyces griseus TaxID=1911 RepID=UPI00369CD3AC
MLLGVLQFVGAGLAAQTVDDAARRPVDLRRAFQGDLGQGRRQRDRPRVAADSGTCRRDGALGGVQGAQKGLPLTGHS